MPPTRRTWPRPRAGSDGPWLSAREAIIPVVNGPRGAGNPQRQGLQSPVAGESDPLNILREEPECSDPAVPANRSAPRSLRLAGALRAQRELGLALGVELRVEHLVR